MTSLQAQISIGFREDPKRFFFDRQRVSRAMDAATRRELSRAGAFVRTRARSSMRRGRRGDFVWARVPGGLVRYRRPSPPGRPPLRHDNPLIYKLMRFAWDPGSRSVVIGPIATKRSGLAALESGGTVAIDGTVLDRASGRRVRRRRLVYLPARPFMAPALAAEVRAGSIPRRFAGSLRRVA